MRKKLLYVIGAPLVLVSVLLLKVEFSFSGDHEGFYLLKGVHGAWLEVTDDLFPEDTDRLIYGYAFPALKHVVTGTGCADTRTPCLNFEWNEGTGRGFIKTSYPDGRKLLICLSRFRDDDNNFSSGLFLGGNLPATDPDARLFDRNETGMAYFDGKRYYHIWCNANEGIIDDSNRLVVPERWKFVGSAVVKNSPGELVLRSSHRASINNVPVMVERTLYYRRGDPYVTLVTRLANVGTTGTGLTYFYGDEPWVGNYGTSAGDVGWLKDRLVTTETEIDTRHNSFAGMFDYGNPLAGEQHVYTNMANFVEWQKENPPDRAYFSNSLVKVGSGKDKVPLADHLNRVIALEWGKFLLQPGQSYQFTIAVGMAGSDPKTLMPVKPRTGLN